MNYSSIIIKVNKFLEEELEIEINRRTYLISKYIQRELCKEGEDWVYSLLQDEEDHFIRKVINTDIENLSSRGKEVYYVIVNYIVNNDKTLEEELGKESLKEAIKISEELFREELEERYNKTF